MKPAVEKTCILYNVCMLEEMRRMVKNEYRRKCTEMISCSFCAGLQPPVSLWISHAVINRSVLSLQSAHVQIHLIFAVVSGDGEPSANCTGIKLPITVILDNRNKFQAFSRSLSDPSHPVAIEVQSRGSAGQFMRLFRFDDHRVRFSQCLTAGIWNKGMSTYRDVRKCRNILWN